MKPFYIFLLLTLIIDDCFGQTNIFPSSGDVGIGTTSPSKALEIVSHASAGNVPLLLLTNTSGATPNTFGPGIVLDNHVSGKSPFIIQQRQDVTSRFSISKYNYPYTDFLCILQNGNVLIGNWSQVNSSYKLDVNGNIRANKVVVNTTGADYVFDSIYHLQSLNQLEKYITKYRHLPGIRSAEEMQKRGIDLGENQTQLLRIVEELTLYQIHAAKRIQALEQKQSELKNEIKVLRAGSNIAANQNKTYKLLPVNAFPTPISPIEMDACPKNPSTRRTIGAGPVADEIRLSAGSGTFGNTKPYMDLSGFNISGSGNDMYQNKVDYLSVTGKIITSSLSIGTQYPQSILAVNDTITVKQMNVTQPKVTDYVSAQPYSLPSSERLADSQRNKHLPQISSAKEVADHGSDLGDMQSKQMQKIEELTIYLIDMDKKLALLQSELSQLKLTNKVLTNRLDTLTSKAKNK